MTDRARELRETAAELLHAAGRTDEAWKLPVVGEQGVLGAIPEDIREKVIGIVDSKIQKKDWTAFFADKFDPGLIAKEFLELYPCYYDPAGLWWVWESGKMRYSVVDDTHIQGLIYEAARDSRVFSPYVRGQLFEALRTLARKKKPKPLLNTQIQFKNCVVDFVSGERSRISPELFATNPLPWDFVEDCNTPVIDQILTQWVGADRMPLLKQIIAFSMSPTYFLHRIFFFIGPGSNGKGKFLGLVLKVLGTDNCCSTDLDVMLNSRFEIGKLHKKLVCLMGETNFKSLSRTSLLKKLSGEDPVGFEMKGKMPFDDINYSKLLIATNGLPVTTDKSDGFYRRMMILDFPNRFTESKDVLAGIPSHEFAALASQCILILKDLWTRRVFVAEGSIEDRAKRYEERSNPMGKFIEGYCGHDPDGIIYKFEFRDRFLAFCKQHGYRQFSEREVTDMLSELGVETKRESHGNRYWCYQGLIWKKHQSVQDVQDVQDTSTQFPNIEKTSGTTLDKLDKLDGCSIFLNWLKDHPGSEFTDILTNFPNSPIEVWIPKLIASGSILENPSGRFRVLQ